MRRLGADLVICLAHTGIAEDRGIGRSDAVGTDLAAVPGIDALVLGQPVFDDTAPKARLVGRRITIFWTRLEVGGGAIADPMCGFRVYPLPVSADVSVWGDRMDFDPEIAVRLVWAGVPIRNVETRVRYVSAEDGGVSHFHAFKDNVLISLMHSRLMTMRIMRLLFGWMWRGRSRGKLPS